MSAPDWSEDYGDRDAQREIVGQHYEAFQAAYGCDVRLPGSAQKPPRDSFEMLLTEGDKVLLRSKFISWEGKQ